MDCGDDLLGGDPLQMGAGGRQVCASWRPEPSTRDRILEKSSETSTLLLVQLEGVVVAGKRFCCDAEQHSPSASVRVAEQPRADDDATSLSNAREPSAKGRKLHCDRTTKVLTAERSSAVAQRFSTQIALGAALAHRPRRVGPSRR
jgi:hypothetical protein